MVCCIVLNHRLSMKLAFQSLRALHTSAVFWWIGDIPNNKAVLVQCGWFSTWQHGLIKKVVDDILEWCHSKSLLPAALQHFTVAVSSAIYTQVICWPNSNKCISFMLFRLFFLNWRMALLMEFNQLKTLLISSNIRKCFCLQLWCCWEKSINTKIRLKVWSAVWKWGVKLDSKLLQRFSFKIQMFWERDNLENRFHCSFQHRLASTTWFLGSLTINLSFDSHPYFPYFR